MLGVAAMTFARYVAPVIEELRSHLGDERSRAAENMGRNAVTAVVIGLIVAQLQARTA